MKKVLQALGFVLIAQSAGLIGSFFTVSSIENWYAFLEKPSLVPPNWLFAPAWITLYTLMGIAVFLIWQKREDKKAKQAVILFFVHLFFNAIWSILFFGSQFVFLALLDIVLVLIFIIVLMRMFYTIDRRATWLMVPYLGWVMFATYLNLGIYILN